MPSAGFTLIELLVVISIIALMTVIGAVNFKDLAANQVAEKGAGQVQTMLRLAQSNATTLTLCDNKPATSWFVKFIDDNNTYKLELHCLGKDSSGNIQESIPRIYTLENAVISVKCSDDSTSCSPNSPTNLPFKVSFSPLYGQATFAGDELCISSPLTSKMKIVVKHASKEKYKCVNISKTGVVDVQ